MQDFYSLWKKFQDGTLTTEEKNALYEWMNRESNHDDMEKFLRQKWEDSGSFGAESGKSASWDIISRKITSSPKVSSGKNTRFLLREISKYAAVVAVTFLLSWAYFAISQRQQNVDEELTEYLVPFGSKSRLILPDGSSVWLNSGSKISYNHNFSKHHRIVRLDGEAYFDVVHQEETPFTVKTSDLNIQVYGTKFNVKSFSDEKIVETTLVKGAITIERLDDGGSIIQKMKMKPNEMVNYFKNEKRLVLISPDDQGKIQISSSDHHESVTNLQPIMATNVEIATAWIDNRLTFKGENIESLINKLQRWYGVEINLQNEEIKKERFTGSFDKETIEQALDALKITFPFHYRMIKNKITIY